MKAARYKVIAFTGDDCVVDSDWLKGLIKGFSDEKIGFVIGRVFYRKKGFRGYFPERLVSNISARWPMTCNIAFRKEVFEAVGGFKKFFSEYTNEDTEMALRALEGKFLFKRSFSAIVFHQADNWTVESLWRSAKNASVWSVLKKEYSEIYLTFGPPVTLGIFVNIEDYFFILALPLLVPFLLIRYIYHGQKDFRIFFAKWPVYLFLRRFYIYKEAFRHKVFML